MADQRKSAKQPLNDSLFHMWRCVVAVAHADGKVQDEELDYIGRVVGNLDRIYALTDVQRRQLEHDLATPANVSDLLPHVTVPEHRAQLIYFAGNMIWADGVVTEEEDAIVKKLHDTQMSALDLDRLHKEVRSELMAHAWEYEAERKAMREQARRSSKTFSALDRLLLKLGIDILD